MANNENLTPFKKGESGNPDGRPPGKSFKTILNKLLDLEATEKDLSDEELKAMLPDGKVTNRDILMARLLLQAKADGDSKSMERLMNRVDGKPIETVHQKLEIGTENKISIVKDGDEISLKVKPTEDSKDE